MKQQNKRAFSRNGNKTQKIKISELKQKLKSLKQSLNQSESSLLDVQEEQLKKRQKSFGGKTKSKLHQQQYTSLKLNDFQVFNNDLQCLSKQELIQLNKNIIMALQNKQKSFEFYQDKYQEIIQKLKKKVLKQKSKIEQEDNEQLEFVKLQDDLQYQRYENLNQRIIDLEKQKQESEKIAIQKDKKINSLKKQKTDLELKFTLEKNDLQNKINILQKKCQNYNNQIKDEKQKIDELKLSNQKQIKKQTIHLQNENNKLLKDIKQTQDNKFQLQQEIEILRGQNERQQNNLKDMKKNCRNLEEKLLEYQQQVDDYDFIKTERDNFRIYIQQLEKQNKQNLEKFLDIQKEYLKLNGEKILWDNFDQDVKNFNREKDSMQNQNIQLEKDNKELNQINQTLKQKLQNIEQQLNDKCQRERQANESQQTQMIKIENLIKENSNLENKLQKKKKQYSDLKTNLDTIQKELYQTKAELEVQKNKHQLEVFQKVIITTINIYQQFLRSITSKRKYTYKKQQSKTVR